MKNSFKGDDNRPSPRRAFSHLPAIDRPEGRSNSTAKSSQNSQHYCALHTATLTSEADTVDPLRGTDLAEHEISACKHKNATTEKKTHFHSILVVWSETVPRVAMRRPGGASLDCAINSACNTRSGGGRLRECRKPSPAPHTGGNKKSTNNLSLI
ncbi:hypothetical protein ECG_07970 [Echinococcus granulosus]|nr:hypothetical protein ECG_07970 [Echinococcus granulosus]